MDWITYVVSNKPEREMMKYRERATLSSQQYSNNDKIEWKELIPIIPLILLLICCVYFWFI